MLIQLVLQDLVLAHGLWLRHCLVIFLSFDLRFGNFDSREVSCKFVEDLVHLVSGFGGANVPCEAFVLSIVIMALKINLWKMVKVAFVPKKYADGRIFVTLLVTHERDFPKPAVDIAKTLLVSYIVCKNDGIRIMNIGF